LRALKVVLYRYDTTFDGGNPVVIDDYSPLPLYSTQYHLKTDAFRMP